MSRNTRKPPIVAELARVQAGIPKSGDFGYRSRRLSVGLLVSLSPCLLVCLLVGCGGERLYDVSGTVTWKGKPVPKGLVFFDPDAAKGATGGQGFANIQDGKFTTTVDGRGVRGGPHRIRILGYDGKPSEELPFGQPLFDEHEESRDLPKADTQLAFDLPGKRK